MIHGPSIPCIRIKPRRRKSAVFSGAFLESGRDETDPSSVRLNFIGSVGESVKKLANFLKKMVDVLRETDPDN
jgi:hypothetical protein